MSHLPRPTGAELRRLLKALREHIRKLPKGHLRSRAKNVYMRLSLFL